MNTEWENSIITELEKMFSAAGINAAVENIEGKNVLVIEYDGEGVPEDCNISIENLADDCTVVFIMLTVASGLNESQSRDILALLPYLNKFLTVGAFGFTESDGYFYYACSLAVEEETDRAVLLKTITHTLDIADATAGEAVSITAPVLNGETPVSELTNDDISIIQF